MTSAEIKQAGIAALRAAGIEVDDNTKVSALATLMRRHGMIQRLTGSATMDVGRAVGAYEGKEVKQVVPLSSRPVYRPAPHPRLADIQRAQPPMIGMRGIGNGNETSGYGRGK